MRGKSHKILPKPLLELRGLALMDVLGHVARLLRRVIETVSWDGRPPCRNP